MTGATESLFHFLRATAKNDVTGYEMAVLLVDDGGNLRPATRAEEVMYDLLTRLRGWDVLNPSAPDGSDAPYWQGEIARVIGD